MQQSDSHWTDFHEIRRFFENPSRRFDFDYYFRITGTVHENLCAFSIAFRLILLRMRYVSDKFVQKVKAFILCSVFFFFGKSCRLWDDVQSAECNVTFPPQQWLRERVTTLCYTYVAFLVYSQPPGPDPSLFLIIFTITLISYHASGGSDFFRNVAAIYQTIRCKTVTLRPLWQLQISDFVC